MIRIDDDNWFEFLPGHTHHSGGLEARDYQSCPVGYLAYAKPFDLPLIPREEWRERLADLKGRKARLSDIRNRGMYGSQIPSRDQDGYGYCWAHSSVSCCLIVRAINNQPYADLSAFSVAAPIKNFRNQGGWGSQSLEWIAEKGVATSRTWPQQSMNRGNVNAEMWADAAQHRITEWMDLDPDSGQYIDQFVTCLLSGIPVVTDLNWWSHSVATLDLEEIDPADPARSIVTNIWNSWGDSWSERGIGQLKGRRAIPDGALAPRVMTGAGQ